MFIKKENYGIECHLIYIQDKNIYRLVYSEIKIFIKIFHLNKNFYTFNLLKISIR